MNKVYIVTTNLTEETNKNFIKDLSDEDQKIMMSLKIILNI